MRLNTTKILTHFEKVGLIDSFGKERVKDDWRGVTETEFHVKSDSISIEHETYGKNMRMYIVGTTTENANRAREALATLGYSERDLNERWYGSLDTHFEIPVAYFKGPHWWE